MENREGRPTSDELKLKVMGRVLLILFGLVAACIMIAATTASLLFATSASGMAAPEPQLQYVSNEDSGPASVPMPEQAPIAPEAPSMPMNNGTNFMAFVPIVLLLTAIFILGYGLYDGYRLYLQYRRTKEADEVLFP